MIDYRTPPLGYLVRVPQESLDSSLDESARSRAEDAARFLSFERMQHVISSAHCAAYETAEMIFISCAVDSQDVNDFLDADSVLGYFSLKTHLDKALVLVLDQNVIQAVVARMTGADVCGEIVAPGGVIPVHRVEGKIVIRARHMVLDFTFTDFVDSVSSVTSVVENAGT
jgi:hypothetical protein